MYMYKQKLRETYRLKKASFSRSVSLGRIIENSSLSLVADGINIIKESHVVGGKYSSLYSLSVLQTFMVACQNAKSILCMFVKLCLIKSNQQVVQDTLKG